MAAADPPNTSALNCPIANEDYRRHEEGCDPGVVHGRCLARVASSAVLANGWPLTCGPASRLQRLQHHHRDLALCAALVVVVGRIELGHLLPQLRAFGGGGRA